MTNGVYFLIILIISFVNDKLVHFEEFCHKFKSSTKVSFIRLEANFVS